MNIERKVYQEKAINSLTKSVSELLKNNTSNKICVFQSPTGSGKTVMVAKFIEMLIEVNNDLDFCFLWLSTGKGELHKQSKKSLERLFNGSPNCVLLEDEFFGSRTHIKQNEVVVCNWEKLYSKYNKGEQKGEWKNRLMRDGELVNFPEVLDNTNLKRKIILIIDESHIGFGDKTNISEIRSLIKADITIEMSATPKIIDKENIKKFRSMESPVKYDYGNSYYIYVDPKDVIEEGMIKKELIINEKLEELVDDEKTSQDIIIEAAYNKRIEIKETFKQIGSNINPLCLIQLPNAEAGIAKREVIEVFLADKGITESNGKLAVWLSEDKSDGLTEISDFESDVEFLLFKQAIDTGWDCPRAHILVKLRDIQSYTFEVQTVGRILRMPEQMHYENEILNTGYIFTNLSRIVVNKEEYNPNIIKHLKSYRKENYELLKLISYYRRRVDYGDIESGYIKSLEQVFCNYFNLEDNITLAEENREKLRMKGIFVDVNDYKEDIIIDVTLKSSLFDTNEGTLNSIIDDKINLKLSDNDLLAVFEDTIKQCLSGFAPKRSIPTVKQSIYLWFRKYLNYQFGDGGLIKIQKIIIHQKNIETFKRLISESTETYRPVKLEEVKNKTEETKYEWDIKNEEYFNEYTDELVDYKLNIYEPCYLKIERSNPEKAFELYLESNGDKIDWWFKNGVSKKDYFGIKYSENDLPQTFYPDFIVKFKSGLIFIGDTKDGQTASVAKLKAEALQKYIKDNNLKGYNLLGGIIIKDNNDQWRLNQRDIYNYNINDLSEWDYLDDIISTQ